MKTLFNYFTVFILFIVIPFCDLHAQSGWFLQNPFPPSSPWIAFTSTFFINDTTGWVVGGWPRKVLKTTDAGNSWIEQTLPESEVTQWLESIYFNSPTKGWAVGGRNGGDEGRILKTIDGGKNWQNIPVANINYMISVKFVSDTTGFAVGNYGVVLKTTDGGENWIQKVSGTTESLYSVFFISPSLGWIVGSNATLLKTTDGGESWIKLVIPPDGYYWNPESVFFITPLKGWIIGDFILMTEDGGNTWIKQNTPQVLRSIYFSTSTTGWAVGINGIILKTTDSGINWQKQVSPTNNHLFSVCFTSPTTGWIVGDYGTILKTNDGGGITSVNNAGNSIITNTYSLSQNYPNPFNPVTSISITIGASNHVSLRVYDVLGREVATIYSGEMSTGSYTKYWDAKYCPSGIYFCRLQVGTSSTTIKMILLK